MTSAADQADVAMRWVLSVHDNQGPDAFQRSF